MIERLLSRDTNVKILAAILALSLWLFVASEENPEATQIVPLIEVIPRNIPEDLALVTMDPAQVSVSLRSRPSFLSNFDPANVEATVDLSDTEAGVAARVVKVQVPDGVQVVDISPSAVVVVALEAMAAREMDVEVSLEGTAGHEITVGKPIVFPGEVRLAGATTKVEAVHRVVSGIDIDGIQENMVFEGVQVFAVDEAGRQVSGVSVTPETVRIIVPVESLPTEAEPLPEAEPESEEDAALS